MGDCCNCSGEVSRDGSGQLSRYLKALDPTYAPVDDRSIEDLLVFTKRYANQIRFYDIPGSNAGDEIYVTLDGQTGFGLQEGDEIAITKAARPLRLIRATSRSYFEVLRQKLKWNER